MVFVTLEHDIRCEGVSAIRERQHIVYREAAATPVDRSAVAPRRDEITRQADATATCAADAVTLFRYSAMTFNAHGIHYDRDHAASEGNSGIVVHGPLLATLLPSHAQQQHPGASVSRFNFRAQAPIFACAPFQLAIHGDRLWIADADGTTAMTADVTWA